MLPLRLMMLVLLDWRECSLPLRTEAECFAASSAASSDSVGNGVGEVVDELETDGCCGCCWWWDGMKSGV